MEAIDLIVLRTLQQWRADGRHGLLATVVRTWGSSPRPVGSLMALCENGSLVGSVSGGCIEDDLVHRFSSLAGADATAPIAPGPPQLVRYGVSADEAHRFGLPCGGTLELLLEFDPDPAGLGELLGQLDQGQLVERSLRLADGSASLRACERPTGLRLDHEVMVNSFGPGYRLLIIGAGQLAEYLATMALFNGFAVTVCDPREEYRGSWSVAGVDLVHEMPDDMVQRFAPDRRSAVVALTHDPKLDDLALLEALGSDAFYIGAIGSRRNNQARRQRLIEHFGATEQSLRRLHGPIGLFIGSKTPPEIAVSVMAELLAVKNGVALRAPEPVGAAKDALEGSAAAPR
ncbi:XdhC family protein [Piscinibacter sakaiensis]|uniref:XdhC family protein n=1 Tax=Piscinibacter sakaiensis TaxID=1547922 RepID=UPI003AAC582C